MIERVIRVERYAIHGNPVGAFLILDVDAVRVIRAHFMQRQDMQHHQRKQHDGQGNHMQCEEAIKCRPRD